MIACEPCIILLQVFVSYVVRRLRSHTRQQQQASSPQVAPGGTGPQRSGRRDGDLW
jgi:hypothetical protein